MSVWLIILGMVVVTFSVRLSVIMVLRDATLPPRLSRALRFVPTAALTAILVPEVVMPGGTIDLTSGNPRLIAGTIAALVAWCTHNTLLSIAAGMLLLWGLMWL